MTEVRHVLDRIPKEVGQMDNPSRETPVAGSYDELRRLQTEVRELRRERLSVWLSWENS